MFFQEEIPSFRVFGLKFGMYTSEDVKKISVKEVTNPQTFDIAMHPTIGGLYDPALGPNERNETCGSCGLTSIRCPGHMGHITLPLPVYNPILFDTMFQLLRGTCLCCNQLRIDRRSRVLLRHQMLLLCRGYLVGVDELEQHKNIYEKDDARRDDISALDQELEALSSKIMDEEVDGKASSRAVQDRKQKLIKDFIGSCTKVQVKCPNCEVGCQRLRAQLHSKIFKCPPSTKKEAEKLKKYNQKRMEMKEKAQQQVRSTEEEEVEIVVPEEDQLQTVESLEKEIDDLMQQTLLTPIDVREQLRKLWSNDGAVIEHILRGLVGHDDVQGCDVFFLDVIPVPASRFRPVQIREGKRYEHAQTTILSRVLTEAQGMNQLLYDRKRKIEGAGGAAAHMELVTTMPDPDDVNKMKRLFSQQLIDSWANMQRFVNSLVDKDLDKMSTEKLPGIKQILEKKAGLFRKNMMGKRVNFAARSVISPDPYISTNEVGVPMVFAKKLTFPEPVTPINFHEMRRAVINGPDQHPGANYVEREDGMSIRLLPGEEQRTTREAIANSLLTPKPHLSENLPNKKVLRHLKSGDVLLLNRQPTLHRPSIQGLKARVLPGEKTLRLHYSSCKAYNADFDGDEMNAHFPQSYLGRAESRHLASTEHHYLVPKDGTPLGGLIQDHMVAGVRLTVRGQMFNREEYNQLIYNGLSEVQGRITLLPPCMLKPKQLWSGKQVLSTVLLNLIPKEEKKKNQAKITLTGTSKVPAKSWGQTRPRVWLAGGTPLEGNDMTESKVIIREGELLCGVLDKAHYGATSYGLVHSWYELYGGEAVNKILTALARLFTSFLQFQGFSLGVEDILCTTRADKRRKKIVKKGRTVGTVVAAKAFGVGLDENMGADELQMRQLYEQAHFSDKDQLRELDLAMKQATDNIQQDIARAIMPKGLIKQFPDNNLQLMVQSGAKGSSVNCMQISCLLGQIELEGRRPPLMMSGQTLPSFVPYDLSPRAGGFVDGRFLTGIRPQEYFFHCMAGREGLIDTAVKTSRSGYLQRCLVKHLEGLMVNYDLTVRDSDGTVVQFQYGEDNLDVSKIQFLKEPQFPFIIQNRKALTSSKKMKRVTKALNFDGIEKEKLKIHKYFAKKGSDGACELTREQKSSPFLQFCNKNSKRLIEHFTSYGLDLQNGRTLAARTLADAWIQEQEKKLKRFKNSTPDPILNKFPPHRHFGAITEKLDAIIDNYMSRNPQRLLSEEDKPPRPLMNTGSFRSLLHLRYQESMVEPGEPVGLLAAQSIGEPSTQMTLNTFHFAGRGEMNVTLGIPRLREILMVASGNIKTPTMDVPVKDDMDSWDKARELKLKLNQVRLSDVLASVDIEEMICSTKEKQNRLYKTRFTFLPKEHYSDRFVVLPTDIIKYMETTFFKNFEMVLRNKTSKLANESLIRTAKIQPRAVRQRDDYDDKADLADEDDDMDPEGLERGAEGVKERERQLQERDYGGEEEEEQELGVKDESEDENQDIFDMMNQESDEKEEEKEAETEEKFTIPRRVEQEFMERIVIAESKAERKKRAKERMKEVEKNLHVSENYQYDWKHERWCEVTFKAALLSRRLDLSQVLEVEAKKAVIHEVPGITRAFLTNPVAGERMHLRTEGVNIQEMHKYGDFLDLNELYTNNIVKMAEVYGIEAARRSITKEMRDVFSVYGIDVNYHHLSLVADYMACTGRYLPFNRFGLNDHPSPLQKMSFETTVQHLKGAILQGATDELKSPSARLVVGRLVAGGTGSFDVLVRMDD